MNLHEEMQTIESHEMAARLNLALNLRQLFGIAQGEEAINSLRKKLDDAETIKLILLRIHELVELSPDPRYENPYDTAIAIYLWVLFTNNNYVGGFAAEHASRLRQGFWTPEYVRHIQVGDILRNEASLSKPIMLEPIDSTRTEANECLIITAMLGSNLRRTEFFIAWVGVSIKPEPWSTPSEDEIPITPALTYNQPKTEPGVSILTPA